MNSEKEKTKKRWKPWLVFAAVMLILVFLFKACVPDGVQPTGEKAEASLDWLEPIPIDLFGERVEPGTNGTHTFAIRNTSDWALQYELMFFGTKGVVPIEYRVKSGDKFLIGSEDKWEKSCVIEDAVKSFGSIPMNGKLDLTVEWKWDFETGNDAYDTKIGILGETEEFYIAAFGIGRDSNKMPTIVKSDFVELIGPFLFPVLVVILVIGTKVFVYIYDKVKKKGRDS